MKLYYDSYSKVLHIGKVMIVIRSDFKFYHSRLYKKAHYFRLGWMAIRI